MEALPSVAGRKLEALYHALGPCVVAALADPAIVEVLVNPDGKVFFDVAAQGLRDSGQILSPDDRERAVRLVADHVGEVVGEISPRLAGVLPTGERFQGMLPPVVTGPAYAIRKRAAAIFRLADYVRDGLMTAEQAAVLQAAAEGRCNLVISGGAGSGKTTLANAILAEPAFAQDRILLIEDTPELQCSSSDLLVMLTRLSPRPIGVGDLVRDALRLRPDRIVVGELRDGSAVLEALKAWNTGHPGGLATVHANSAAEVIDRLSDLLTEVLPASGARLIAQGVDRIVHIERAGGRRQVEEILAVAPCGEHGAPALTRLA